MSVAVKCGSDVVTVTFEAIVLVSLKATSTGDPTAMSDAGDTMVRPLVEATEMLGPRTYTLPAVSVTVAVNLCVVPCWAESGFQVKVFVVLSNVMPVGMLPGVTVTVSPDGALVWT